MTRGALATARRVIPKRRSSELAKVEPFERSNTLYAIQYAWRGPAGARAL